LSAPWAKALQRRERLSPQRTEAVPQRRPQPFSHPLQGGLIFEAGWGKQRKQVKRE